MNFGAVVLADFGRMAAGFRTREDRTDGSHVIDVFSEEDGLH